MASEFRRPTPLHGLSRGVLDPAVQHLAEENAALRCEAARLRQALAPFAEWAGALDDVCDPPPNDKATACVTQWRGQALPTVTVGDCRAAAQALEEAPPAPEPRGKESTDG